MKKIKIGIISGSARTSSYNTKAALMICGYLPEPFESSIIQIDDLPLFHQDLEAAGRTPAQWLRFREEVAAMDAYLFATPEYNRSYTPLIKNAVDIASRPPGQNLWNNKPAAVISVSLGRTGGFGANQHLRQVLNFLNLRLLNQPETYLGDASHLFPEDSTVSSDVEKLLQELADAYGEWVLSNISR